MTHEGCGCLGPSVLIQTTLPYLMLIYLTLHLHVLMQHELNGRLLCVKNCGQVVFLMRTKRIKSQIAHRVPFVWTGSHAVFASLPLSLVA